MKRNSRDKSISLLLAVAMVIQTILPTLIFAQEKASPQAPVTIQGISQLPESQVYTLSLDPASLDESQDPGTLTLQLQKKQVLDDVLSQLEQTWQTDGEDNSTTVSTLVYHKSLAPTPQTLQKLEAVGYTVETALDLEAQAQAQTEAQTQEPDFFDFSTDEPVIISRSFKEDEVQAETDQAQLDLPDFGPDYDYIQLTLLEEDQALIDQVLQTAAQDPDAYQDLEAKAARGQRLKEDQAQTLAILDTFSYSEEEDPDTKQTIQTISLSLTFDQAAPVQDADLVAYVQEDSQVVLTDADLQDQIQALEAAQAEEETQAVQEEVTDQALEDLETQDPAQEDPESTTDQADASGEAQTPILQEESQDQTPVQNPFGQITFTDLANEVAESLTNQEPEDQTSPEADSENQDPADQADSESATEAQTEPETEANADQEGQENSQDPASDQAVAPAQTDLGAEGINSAPEENADLRMAAALVFENEVYMTPPSGGEPEWGVYRADYGDVYSYRQGKGEGSNVWKGMCASFDLYIRLPQGTTAGTEFTLDLPHTMDLNAVANDPSHPTITIYNQLVTTEKLLLGYYEYDHLTNTRSLRFKVTADGAAFMADKMLDTKVQVWHPIQVTAYDDYPEVANVMYPYTLKAGLTPYLAEWAYGADTSPDSVYENARIYNSNGTMYGGALDGVTVADSVTKTHRFQSTYNGVTTEITDTSTFKYHTDNLRQDTGAINPEDKTALITRHARNNSIQYMQDGTRYLQDTHFIKDGVRTFQQWQLLLKNQMKIDSETVNNKKVYKIKVYETAIDHNSGTFIANAPKTDVTENYNISVTNSDRNVSVTPKSGTTPPNGETVGLRIDVLVTTTLPYNSTETFEYTMKTDGTGGSITRSRTAGVGASTYDAYAYPLTEATLAKVTVQDGQFYTVTNGPATFDLYEVTTTGDNLVATGLTTGADGSLKLTGLMYGSTYKVKETAAPTGYNLNNQEVVFTISGEGPTQGHAIIASHTKADGTVVSNFDVNDYANGGQGYIPFSDDMTNPPNEITILKQDQNGVALPGAEFLLVKEADDTAQPPSPAWSKTLVTGADGKIVLHPYDYPVGTYTIKEIKAPTGYKIDSLKAKTFQRTLEGTFIDISDSQPAQGAQASIEPSQADPIQKKSNLASNFFESLVDKLSAALEPTVAHAQGTGYKVPDLPGEYEYPSVIVTGDNQPITDGVAAQKVTISPPIVQDGINTTYSQNVYINPDGVNAYSSPSNVTFRYYGALLQRGSGGAVTQTQPSATIIYPATVRVYKMASTVALPANPKDFVYDSSVHTDVTDQVNLEYVGGNNPCYEIKFGNTFDTSKDKYVFSIQGTAENSFDPVSTGASIFDGSPGYSFPFIIAANAGGAVGASMERTSANLSIVKRRYAGPAINNNPLELWKDGVKITTGTYIGEDNVQGGAAKFSIFYEGLRPGIYTIKEPAPPTDSEGGTTITYNDCVPPGGKSWDILIEDKDYDNYFEYIILSDDYLIDNSLSPPHVNVYNVPDLIPLELTIKLFEQDGTTPLDGGPDAFTVTQNGTPLTVTKVFGQTGVYKVIVPSKDDIVIKQVTVPTGYSNNEAEWTLSMMSDPETGQLSVDVPMYYSFIRGGGETVNVVNRTEKVMDVFLPPAIDVTPSQPEQNIQYTFTNSKYYGFEFTKQDNKTPATNLPGAEFKLTRNDTGVIQMATSGNDGKVNFTNLYPGEYTLEETKAPSGYAPTGTLWTIVVEADGTIHEKGQTGAFGPVINEEVTPGRLNLTKVDAETKTGLAGAVFTLTKNDNSIDPIVSQPSGDDGKISFTGLTPGNYTLTETTPPTGYIASGATWNVTVFANQETTIAVTGGVEPHTGIDSTTGTIGNQAEITGEAQFFFTKTKEDGTTALAGATFKLTHSGGQTWTQTSGTDGKVTFTNLAPGSYTLVEIEAPEGYVVDPTVHTIVIDDNFNVSRNDIPGTGGGGSVDPGSGTQPGLSPLNTAKFNEEGPFDVTNGIANSTSPREIHPSKNPYFTMTMGLIVGNMEANASFDIVLSENIDPNDYSNFVPPTITLKEATGTDPATQLIGTYNVSTRTITYTANQAFEETFKFTLTLDNLSINRSLNIFEVTSPSTVTTNFTASLDGVTKGQDINVDVVFDPFATFTLGSNVHDYGHRLLHYYPDTGKVDYLLYWTPRMQGESSNARQLRLRRNSVDVGTGSASATTYRADYKTEEYFPIRMPDEILGVWGDPFTTDFRATTSRIYLLLTNTANASKAYAMKATVDVAQGNTVGFAYTYSNFTSNPTIYAEDHLTVVYKTGSVGQVTEIDPPLDPGGQQDPITSPNTDVGTISNAKAPPLLKLKKVDGAGNLIESGTLKLNIAGPTGGQEPPPVNLNPEINLATSYVIENGEKVLKIELPAGTPDGEYIITETQAPTGYIAGEPITFIIQNGEVLGQKTLSLGEYGKASQRVLGENNGIYDVELTLVGSGIAAPEPDPVEAVFIIERTSWSSSYMTDYQNAVKNFATALNTRGVQGNISFITFNSSASSISTDTIVNVATNGISLSTSTDQTRNYDLALNRANTYLKTKADSQRFVISLISWNYFSVSNTSQFTNDNTYVRDNYGTYGYYTDKYSGTGNPVYPLVNYVDEIHQGNPSSNLPSLLTTLGQNINVLPPPGQGSGGLTNATINLTPGANLEFTGTPTSKIGTADAGTVAQTASTLDITGLNLGPGQVYVLTYKVKAQTGATLASPNPVNTDASLKPTGSATPSVNLPIVSIGGSQVIDIVNETKGNVFINKVDQDSNPLPGAVFGLFEQDGTSPILKDGVQWTATSDQNGRVTFDITTPGTYVIKEIQAPQGYDPTTETWMVGVNSEGKVSLYTPGTATTSEVRAGNFDTSSNTIGIVGSRITEVDTANKTFTQLVYVNPWIYRTNQGAIAYDQSYFNPTLYLTPYGEAGYEVPAAKSGATNSSGTKITSAEVYRVINVNTTSMPNDFDVTLTNTNYYRKYDNFPTSTYEGVGLSIEFGSNFLVNYTGQTKASGAIVKVKGTYSGDTPNLITSSRFRYTNYNNGYYYENAQSWNEFDITSGAPVPGQWVNELTLTAINTRNEDPLPSTGKLEITKVGSDGNVLANVSFGLYTETYSQITPQTQPAFSGTTNSLGLLVFNNIPQGIYTLIETSSQEGYIETDEYWTVTVDADGKTRITSGDGSGTTPSGPTPTMDEHGNITFPTRNGTLNAQTQVSSPATNQNHTYYPSYPNPIKYTSEQDGEYAVDFHQTAPSLRNVWLKHNPQDPNDENYDGYLTYEGNYQTYFTQDWYTIYFAKMAKYAEKVASAEHDYKITLKVKGNTFPEKNVDRLGVIILYDNSSSMGWSVSGTSTTRAAVAKEATTDFVEALKAKMPDTEFALITYGSTIFDGQQRTTNFNGGVYTANIPYNACYKDNFTGNTSLITSRLPDNVPSSYTNSNFWYFGGTHTGAAFVEAKKLVDLAKARTTNKFDRLVIVNVTDGVPTRSPIIQSVTTTEGVKTTTFANYADLGTTTTGIKGDGQFYLLNSSRNLDYHKPYSATGLTDQVTNHGTATELASTNLKNLHTEVFNIGIDITGNNLTSEENAKTLMANISSGPAYNYDLSDADQLPDAFNAIIQSVYRDTISGGIVTDPMGDKFDLVLNGEFSADDYTMTAYKDGVEKDELLNGVTPAYDPATKTITLSGLNLGLDEEVVFTYTVRLRADDPLVNENVYYYTNKETTLKPNPSVGDVAWNFPVPSAKKIGTETPHELPTLQVANYLKPDITFTKTTVIGQPLAGAKFQLYKTVSGGDPVPVGGVQTTGTDGKLTFTGLDVGTYELRETEAPLGYKLLDNPAATFEVTAKGAVTNVSSPYLGTSGQNAIVNEALPGMYFDLEKLDQDGTIIQTGQVTFKISKPDTNTAGGPVPEELQNKTFDLQLNELDVLPIHIPLAMSGEYILEEISAPSGYARTAHKFHIVIDQSGRTIKLTKVTDANGNEIEYKYKGSQGTIVTHDFTQSGPITLYSEAEGGIISTINLSIINRQVVYPATGGKGIYSFLITGMTLMGLASFQLMRRRRLVYEHD